MLPMVVFGLLHWHAPAILILLVVLLLQNEKVNVGRGAIDFVELFCGAGAITQACRDLGMCGSGHDLEKSPLMNLMTPSGFL